MGKLLCGAKQIGEYLGMSYKKVYHLIESRPDFPSFKIGTGRKAAIYARPEAIDEWLQKVEKGDD